MKKSQNVYRSLLVLMFVLVIRTPVFSSTLLSDWAFNVNGTTYEHDPAGANNDFSILPPYFDYSAFNTATGLGTIVVSYAPGPEGDYYFIGFLDHDIAMFDNGFFNEYGNTQGSPVAGQSWEIDEPGYVFGDIYDHVLAGVLDNTNSIPPGTLDDVSMAFGFNFHLIAGQSAVIRLHVTENPADIPPGVFYLEQVDPDSNEFIYFFSEAQKTYTLEVKTEGTGSGVVSAPGIDCGLDCSEVYYEDTQVTLKAKPDTGSEFKGWSGGGCSGTGDCVVTMSSDVAVSAEFALKTPLGRVPALGTWGMIFCGLFLAAAAIVLMKRKGPEMKGRTLILLGLVLVLGVAADGWCAGQGQTSPTKESVPISKGQARFEALDTNHDGVLSYEEFVGDRGPSAQAEGVFRSRDTNGDGVLSIDEFCSGRGSGKTQIPK